MDKEFDLYSPPFIIFPLMRREYPCLYYPLDKI